MRPEMRCIECIKFSKGRPPPASLQQQAPHTPVQLALVVLGWVGHRLDAMMLLIEGAPMQVGRCGKQGSRVVLK